MCSVSMQYMIGGLSMNSISLPFVLLFHVKSGDKAFAKQIKSETNEVKFVITNQIKRLRISLKIAHRYGRLK